MASVEKLLQQMRNSTTNVRYTDLYKVCEHYFGEPRQNGTAHAVFRTPWPGKPYVNIQSRNGQGKPYQVEQVIDAIDKLAEIRAQQQEGDQ